MNVIQLRLTNKQQLTISRLKNQPELATGYRRLEVLYCAICRTDGKMWKSGHRDLILPRVPGHEISARDPVNGKLYTVWPGQSCGECRYCLSGRDNLCNDMRIIGFHSDGGFSNVVDVPQNSLIPIKSSMEPKLLCFTEPVGCVINCLHSLRPEAKDQIIIYGGGVVGLLAALACQTQGADVVVVENSSSKKMLTKQFCNQANIKIVSDSPDTKFDIAINCCDSPQAFSEAILRLRKGGKFGYFSGLAQGSPVKTDILNLLHYRELAFFGSYGPRRQDMSEAVTFCRDHKNLLPLLIEEVIRPQDVPLIMEQVASGKRLKYLIDFENG